MLQSTGEWGLDTNNSTEPVGSNSTVHGTRYIGDGGESFSSMIQPISGYPLTGVLDFFTTINRG